MIALVNTRSLKGSSIFAGKMSKTFEYEELLPKLPVPSLESTSEQVLRALKPLLTTEEYAELEEESYKFEANSTIQLIQKHLEEVSKNPSIGCYLNSINDETHPGIYGELKGEILPRNPYLILENDPYSKTLNPLNQAQRAATLINSTLKFVVSLRNGTLRPDLTPKHGTPLTMRCYDNIFGTTRIPFEGRSSGHHVSIKRYQNINDSRHIVVISNNQYYSLEVLTPSLHPNEKAEKTSRHEIWFSDHELAVVLQDILNDSYKVQPTEAIKNSIGALTTQTFGYWKLARAELKRTNPNNLSTIDNALFIVSLDHESPTTDKEMSIVISHGTSKLLKGTNIQIGSCTSRWYDKLQLVVTKNSVAGVVWESSSMDSTAILRFISDIYTDSILKLAKNINGSEYTLFDLSIKFYSGDRSSEKPIVNKLIFDKSRELVNLIRLSETRLADLIHQHEYETLDLKLNSALVSKLNLSVDSLIQIAFQIANYTLYGRIVNTLEPITTRKFRDARTELIPVQTELVVKVAKLYISNSEKKYFWKLFQECCKAHTTQYRSAMEGMGFERHLMALTYVLKRQDMVDYLNKVNRGKPDLPEIPPLHKIAETDVPLLSNPLIERMSSPGIIISNCGNPALHLFGIPPATDTGFGIGYIIHKDKVLVTVSSKFRQTSRFMDTFHRVINDIMSTIKQESSFLLDISDSVSRKKELQQLRIENELKNIDLDAPLKKHPIPLVVEKTQFPLDSIKPEDYGYPPTSRKSSESENDFDILGGYGYFSFGDLDMRSDQLSREESFLNSSSHSASRNHSSTNLAQPSYKGQADFMKKRLAMSDEIRNRISSENLSNSDISSNSKRHEEEEQKPKSTIGRQLNTFTIP